MFFLFIYLNLYLFSDLKQLRDRLYNVCVFPFLFSRLVVRVQIKEGLLSCFLVFYSPSLVFGLLMFLLSVMWPVVVTTYETRRDDKSETQINHQISSRTSSLKCKCRYCLSSLSYSSIGRCVFSLYGKVNMETLKGCILRSCLAYFLERNTLIDNGVFTLLYIPLKKMLRYVELSLFSSLKVTCFDRYLRSYVRLSVCVCVCLPLFISSKEIGRK